MTSSPHIALHVVIRGMMAASGLAAATLAPLWLNPSSLGDLSVIQGAASGIILVLLSGIGSHAQRSFSEWWKTGRVKSHLLYIFILMHCTGLLSAILGLWLNQQFSIGIVRDPKLAICLWLQIAIVPYFSIIYSGAMQVGRGKVVTGIGVLVSLFPIPLAIALVTMTNHIVGWVVGLLGPAALISISSIIGHRNSPSRPSGLGMVKYSIAFSVAAIVNWMLIGGHRLYVYSELGASEAGGLAATFGFGLAAISSLDAILADPLRAKLYRAGPDEHGSAWTSYFRAHIAVISAACASLALLLPPVLAQILPTEYMPYLSWVRYGVIGGYLFSVSGIFWQWHCINRAPHWLIPSSAGSVLIAIIWIKTREIDAGTICTGINVALFGGLLGSLLTAMMKGARLR
jgi:hypothetical protein